MREANFTSLHLIAENRAKKKLKNKKKQKHALALSLSVSASRCHSHSGTGSSFGIFNEVSGGSGFFLRGIDAPFTRTRHVGESREARGGTRTRGQQADDGRLEPGLHGHEVLL